MPRLSSPLDAKASVRSPYALDRSQQNSCVGTDKTVCRYEAVDCAHTCALIIVFADNDVFSGPPSKRRPSLGGWKEPDKPFNSRCHFALAGGTPGEGNLILSAITVCFKLRRTMSCRPGGAGQDGGARRDRTDDLMLAKHALYQLSYGPLFKGRSARAVIRPIRRRVPQGSVVGPGRLELPTSRLSGVCSNQLSYRPLKQHIPSRARRQGRGTRDRTTAS